MTDIKEPNPLEELRRAADEGDSDAQSQLGTMLAAGEGVEQDPEEALSWLTKAAEQGNLTAVFNLGIIYEKGIGVTQDDNEAVFWFWQAAEKEDVGARMKLGTMLLKDLGFSDDSRATQAITASAESGLAYAQAFLGKLYLEGVGFDQDFKSAEKWLRSAAAQGDEGGIFNLAEMMVEDRTSMTSEDEAAQWFYDLGQKMLAEGNMVKAFDCLVSIKRLNPENFLARRLEDDIERASETPQPPKH